LGARLLAALRTHPEAVAGIVVVHDPLYAMAPSSLIVAMVRMLTGQNGVPNCDGAPDCAAVLPVRPVTDTLKWVDQQQLLTGTADREGFRVVCSPQAYRAATLSAVLSTASPQVLGAIGADQLPGLLQAAGGRLRLAPGPGELFKISTADDVLLAEAMFPPSGVQCDDHGEVSVREAALAEVPQGVEDP
jgi:2-C-methyl-D-erythritol 4-phosphate cytidylyltransferase